MKLFPLFMLQRNGIGPPQGVAEAPVQSPSRNQTPSGRSHIPPAPPLPGNLKFVSKTQTEDSTSPHSQNNPPGIHQNHWTGNAVTQNGYISSFSVGQSKPETNRREQSQVAPAIKGNLNPINPSHRSEPPDPQRPTSIQAQNGNHFAKAPQKPLRHAKKIAQEKKRSEASGSPHVIQLDKNLPNHLTVKDSQSSANREALYTIASTPL